MDLNFFFFRDNHQKEIDIIIEDGQKIKACEIKASKTINPVFTKGLKYWEDLTGHLRENQFIIYGGEENSRRKGFLYCSWKNCYSIIKN